MLQKAYFLAKIGVDTAENERKFAKNWRLPYGSTTLPSIPSTASTPVPRRVDAGPAAPARCPPQPSFSLPLMGRDDALSLRRGDTKETACFLHMLFFISCLLSLITIEARDQQLQLGFWASTET